MGALPDKEKIIMESLALIVGIIVIGWGVFGLLAGFAIGETTKNKTVTVICLFAPGFVAGHYTQNIFFLLLWLASYVIGWLVAKILNREF